MWATPTRDPQAGNNRIKYSSKIYISIKMSYLFYINLFSKESTWSSGAKTASLDTFWPNWTISNCCAKPLVRCCSQMVNGQGFVTTVFSHQSFNSGGRWGRKRKKKKNIALNLSKSGKTVVGVSKPPWEESTRGKKEANKELIQRRILTSEGHGVPFVAAN